MLPLNGCNGGSPAPAYLYIQFGNPLMQEAQYPYTAAKGACRYNKAAGVGSVSSVSPVIPFLAG